MDEQALRGFLAALWALARLMSAIGVLIAGLVFFLQTLFPPRQEAAGLRKAYGYHKTRPAAGRSPALPRRPGVPELSVICAGAMTRGYYRSLVAERLRALGRDALAISEGLSDEGAYKRLRETASFIHEDAAELLFSDHFATPRAGRARKTLPRLLFKKASSGLSPEAPTSFVTPYLARIDTYLIALRDYMHGSGGTDGQHTD